MVHPTRRGAEHGMAVIYGIGPFFHGYPRKRINWSKIPFEHLETASGLQGERLRRIRMDFACFVTAAAGAGFNAVTLDDLAHLYPWASYEARLQAKIKAYSGLYRELFAIAAQAGLRVFITTDIMFYTPELARYPGRNFAALLQWWEQALVHVFGNFPEIAGVIMRFGESDAHDVTHMFRSLDREGGRGKPSDRQAGVRGQDRPESGGDAAGSDLRAGLSRQLVWLSARSPSSRCTARVTRAVHA
jgi:hypothetical protein